MISLRLFFPISLQILLTLTLAFSSIHLTTRMALAQAPDPVYLGPGDVLNMRFQGRDSLDGEYIIGVEGDLFFPGIGSVTAAGRTVGEVALELDGLMRETFSLNSRTFALSVAEFRPIYVGGRVRQPGSYPFRPGLRVAHAVAMAGGTRGLSSEEPVIALETGREYTRLRIAEDQLASALSRRNRLLKELGLNPDPDATEDKLSDLIGSEDTAFRAQVQTAIADIQTDVDDIQRSVLERRAETAQGEVDALQSQLAALNDLLQISTNELKILEDPSERGIIPRSRILELQRLVASTNGEISATLSRRFSAESSLRAFDGDSKLIEGSRRLQNLLELSLADADVSALRRTVQTSRATLDDIGGLPSRDGENCGIEVWRTTQNGLDILPADQTFGIQPGDFVRLVEKTADGTCDRQTQ